uniref:Uncharacterized protein n=1 Tax=Rhizophora mucronata TaxID=61149 RepID=A0A2P2Q269_RHIMU
MKFLACSLYIQSIEHLHFSLLIKLSLELMKNP